MISAADVKALRDKTGAGMMDCKKALEVAKGDIEKAIDALRKSGAAKAEKKTGRATDNGKTFAIIEGNTGSMVEILCETDFAANTDNFQSFVEEIAKSALTVDGDGCVTEEVNKANEANLVDKIAIIGENMQIRRVAKWTTDGKLAFYIHGGGRVGVMVDVEGETDDEFLNDICMHIAAFNPQFISADEIPADVLEREKEVVRAQHKGKPDNIIDRILTGVIAKYCNDITLEGQPWIRDDKTTLAKLKPNLKVNRFIRWEVGEETE